MMQILNRQQLTHTHSNKIILSLLRCSTSVSPKLENRNPGKYVYIYVGLFACVYFRIIFDNRYVASGTCIHMYIKGILECSMYYTTAINIKLL